MGLDLRSTISLDGSGFEHGIERVTDSLKGFALSAFGIYGVEQAIHKTIETAEELVNTANRLGIGIEKFQELKFAAKQSGLEIETLTKFIENLNKNRVDPDKLVHFQRLGIAKPSQGDVTEVVQQLSAFVKLHGTQQISPDLIKVGGKMAGEAINFLNQNLSQLAEEAHNLGLIMSRDDLVSLKFLAEEFKILSDVLIARLAPALRAVMEVALYGINALKAGYVFFSEIVKKVSFKDLLNAFFNPFTTNKKVTEAFDSAGVSAATVLATSNLATDALLAKLKKDQEDREKRNLVPEGESIAAPKVIRSQVYSDSLLRVGNFLGSSSNPLLEIGRVHTTLLTRIAKNTDRITSGGSARSSLPIL